MKRILSALLALTLILSIAPRLPLTAHAASQSDLTFALNADGNSYSVEKCNTNASGALSIPATYNGKPVTAIGDYAFSYCTELSSITFGDSVTSIGDYAFYCCQRLNNVMIPDSVTDIGQWAFWSCTGLTNVTLGDNVASIGSYAFRDCPGLTGIDIPNSLTYIGDGTFDGCTNLNYNEYNNAKYLGNANNPYVALMAAESSAKEYNINNDTKAISGRAFAGCTGLTSISIPDGVAGIGDFAFLECTNLTDITIPESVTRIGEGAFYQCTGLTNVTVPNGVTGIDRYTFLGCTALTNITIPNSVTSIGREAFSGCTGLTSITIPDSVASIDYAAFKGCTGLASVTIPDSVTSIGSSAFRDCSGLSSVIIGNRVTSIGEQAFYSCTGLTNVTIPGSVTSIGEEAFYGCSVEKLIIAQGTKTITSAMVVCESTLQEVVIPDSVTGIGEHAFRDCTSLTGVTIPDGVTGIGRSAFYNCSQLTSIVIPDSVTSIGDYAFYGCASLTGVTIPDGVTGIGYAAFYSCNQLTSIVIPDSVTDIGDYAFNSCASLTGVTIPDSVASIGDYAFYHCTNLNYNSYKDAKYLGNANNPYVILVKVDACNESYSIHSDTKFIASVAFKNCTGMTSIVIPDSVTTIGKSAFNGCNSLTSIILPKSVKTIGTDAFYGCNQLAHVWYYGSKNDAKSITGDKPIATWHYNYCGADNHSYDNSCDSVCNTCDYSREVSHSYDNTDDLTCNVCKQTLAPAAPTGQSVTDTTVTLSAVDGYEYSMDAATWQISNVFTGLQPATTYKFYQRVAAGADNLASPASFPTYITTKKYTANAPGAPVVEAKTSTSVTLQEHPGYEYSIDGKNWQTSNLFTGLSSETEYTFFQRIAETDDNYASPSSHSITVTTLRAFTVAYDALGGINAPEAQTKDQGIDLVLSGTAPRHSSYMFEGWSTTPYGEVAYRFGDTYKEDADITLYAVWVQRCSTCNGEGYTLVDCSLCDGTGDWWGMVSTCCNDRTGYYQETHGESYYFCRSCGQRCNVIYGRADCEKTQKSVCVSCSGDRFLKRTPPAPPQPELLNTTSSSVTVVPQSGMEYSIDGKTWQSGNAFEGLTPNTQYKIYQRYKKNSYFNAGVASLSLQVMTSKNTQTAPPAPTLSSKTANTVVLVAVPGCEYSKDGIIWQQENVFEDLEPLTEYVFYQRKYEDAQNFASASSAGLRIVTDDLQYTVVFKNWDGTILSTEVCHLGDVVVIPPDPAKAADNTCTYTFIGWDNEVVNCTGDAIYTAVYEAAYIEYKVEFVDWDGTILSSQNYHWADAITAPADPTRPNDGENSYTFAGWDKEIAACTGDATYTAVYNAQALATGDYNNDGMVTDADAIYLLRHTLFPGVYPLEQPGDTNADGEINDADAIYLLRHTLFPSVYPLFPKKQ